jgi:uncharacterized glyoxalase superfamily protein PhnB
MKVGRLDTLRRIRHTIRTDEHLKTSRPFDHEHSRSSQGYHTLTPSLNLRDANKALAFYQKALGAVELYRMPDENGGVMHGEMQIGDSVVMFCDENPEWGALSPQSVGGCPLSLNLYVPDCDALTEQAVAAGAQVQRRPTSYPWGEAQLDGNGSLRIVLGVMHPHRGPDSGRGPAPYGNMESGNGNLVGGPPGNPVGWCFYFQGNAPSDPRMGSIMGISFKAVVVRCAP